MGGLAAILHRDGRPFDSRLLDRLIAAAGYRGPDGVSRHVTPTHGLAHLRFGTTTDDGGSGVIDEPGRAVSFVFDGRLDNRDDLLRELDLPVATPDARLACEAVLRWDLDAPAKLLGDFAFVAWDDRRRRVLAARDHMGIRHLHYCARGETLVLATDLAQVLAHPDVPREPDPEAIADYLAIDVSSGPRTLYRGVGRVPPGHRLVADQRGVRVEPFWVPEPATPIRYARDDDYASACRERIVRAVAARLRSDRPVAAMLSGGVDSSSVVSIAARAVPGGVVHPFSMIYPDHPESDERPFIEAVERHCGTPSVRVQPGRITAAALERQVRSWSEAPSMPADEMAGTLYAAMRDRGHRVTLTGAGGDFLFGGSIFQYADLLRRFRVVAALKQFVADGRADDTGRSPLALLQAGVWPLLPRPVKTLLRPVARRIAGIETQPKWLRVARAPSTIDSAPRGGSFATEEVTRLLGSGMHTYFVETAERAAALAGIELRHPLLDVRLVEFALNIPDDQRKRGSETKFVLRRALGDDLAEAVRVRRTKGDFAHAIAEAIEALGGERFYSTLRLAEAGWVDGGLLSATYRKMRDAYGQGHDVYGEYVPELWMVAAVELWFRGEAARPEAVY